MSKLCVKHAGGVFCRRLPLPHIFFHKTKMNIALGTGRGGAALGWALACGQANALAHPRSYCCSFTRVRIWYYRSDLLYTYNIYIYIYIYIEAGDHLLNDPRFQAGPTQSAVYPPARLPARNAARAHSKRPSTCIRLHGPLTTFRFASPSRLPVGPPAADEQCGLSMRVGAPGRDGAVHSLQRRASRFESARGEEAREEGS